jgi:hypothetical protein
MRRQPVDHHFGLLLMLAVTVGTVSARHLDRYQGPSIPSPGVYDSLKATVDVLSEVFGLRTSAFFLTSTIW